MPCLMQAIVVFETNVEDPKEERGYYAMLFSFPPKFHDFSRSPHLCVKNMRCIFCRAKYVTGMEEVLQV